MSPRWERRPKAALLFVPFLLLGLLPDSSHSTFLRSEMDVIDAEPLLDSEYFVDLLAFSPPLEAEWEWELALATRPAAAYRINGASLDCCSLLLQQEASFRRLLVQGLDFRYDLRQDSAKELDEFHQWLALEAGPWRWLSAGVFGEPTANKQDADIGWLGRVSPLPGLSVYALRNSVDWNFNSRNATGETYAKRPTTYEAGLEAWTPAGRIRPRVEVDTPLERLTPATGQRYRYRRTSAELRWDLPPAQERRPGYALRYRYEYKQEGLLLIPDPSGRTLDVQRSLHHLRAAAVLPAGKTATLEAGAEGLWRRARAELPGAAAPRSTTLRWEVHPYARLRRPLSERLVSELAGFMSYGELRRASPGASLHSTPVEAKAVLGLDFRFAGSGRIGLYSNFDLDDADRHVWDGGNIRAQFVF